ncbi:MAG: hypothetical protein V1753_07340 [Pseudomonadota bacterium]
MMKINVIHGAFCSRPPTHAGYKVFTTFGRQKSTPGITQAHPVRFFAISLTLFSHSSQSAFAAPYCFVRANKRPPLLIVGLACWSQPRLFAQLPEQKRLYWLSGGLLSSPGVQPALIAIGTTCCPGAAPLATASQEKPLHTSGIYG